MTLLKTRTQIEREQKHAKIISLYRQLKKQNPTAKPYRIMVAVGEQLNYTPYGVRKVLERYSVSF